MIWFTSDPHFGHKNVIKYSKRPYETLLERLVRMFTGKVCEAAVLRMNEALVRNWNAIVSPEDTVYILGDFSLGKNWVTEIVPRLNGEKHLIAGNHDWVHPIHYKKEAKGEKMRQLYFEAGFTSIQLQASINIDGETVLMHHMPYSGGGDHTEEGERFEKWRLENKGLWLLHGHVHEHWKIKNKMINVGVDQWNYRPVSIDEIRKIIKGE